MRVWPLCHHVAHLHRCAAQWLLFNGLEENLALSNAKLVLMAIACAAAVLTHFNGMTFPENRWFIAAAIGVYLAISAVLQVMATLWEGDLLMRSIASKVCLSGMHRLIPTHTPHTPPRPPSGALSLL